MIFSPMFFVNILRKAINMTGRISTHVTYKEATHSDTANKHGIANIPTDCEIRIMKATAAAIFEPVRAEAGIPIKVTSFFRCLELNRKLGSGDSSQHVKGEAMDLQTSDELRCSNAEIFHFIKDNLDFDQLIWEYGTDDEPAWIHVSYKSAGDNRGQALIKRVGQAYKPYR